MRWSFALERHELGIKRGSPELKAEKTKIKLDRGKVREVELERFEVPAVRSEWSLSGRQWPEAHCSRSRQSQSRCKPE